MNVRVQETGGTRVETSLPNGVRTLDVSFTEPDGRLELPVGSPFPNWHTARRFAGPMPFTFSPESEGTCVVIEASRQEWAPKPLSVQAWHVGFFDEAPLRGATPILASAFAVSGVAYRWKRGRIVQTGGAH